MADVNSTTTQNQTQQQPQTAPQNQPTQASGTQQPQTDKHEENNSGGEVTVESLMAQLAQEKAANAETEIRQRQLCTPREIFANSLELSRQPKSRRQRQKRNSRLREMLMSRNWKNSKR